MSNRPDPIRFARYSYYLAFASALIVLMVFVISLPFFRSDLTSALVNVVWVALITGGIGTFFAYAARADFKRTPGPAEAVRHARVGWRVNLGALLVVLVWAAFYVVISLIASGQGVP